MNCEGGNCQGGCAANCRCQGRNVTRMISLRVSRTAALEGAGIADVIAFFRDTPRLRAAIGEATAWVAEAIAAIKAVPGNTFGDDDEAIAGEILRLVEEEKGAAVSDGNS